jgi:hypothetical protein
MNGGKCRFDERPRGRVNDLSVPAFGLARVLRRVRSPNVYRTSGGRLTGALRTVVAAIAGLESEARSAIDRARARTEPTIPHEFWDHLYELLMRRSD